MSKYVLTATDKSSERLALIKIDEIIEKLILITSKLDADVGVAQTNFSEVLKDLKSISKELKKQL